MHLGSSGYARLCALPPEHTQASTRAVMILEPLSMAATGCRHRALTGWRGTMDTLWEIKRLFASLVDGFRDA